VGFTFFLNKNPGGLFGSGLITSTLPCWYSTSKAAHVHSDGKSSNENGKITFCDNGRNCWRCTVYSKIAFKGFIGGVSIIFKSQLTYNQQLTDMGVNIFRFFRDFHLVEALKQRNKLSPHRFLLTGDVIRQ